MAEKHVKLILDVMPKGMLGAGLGGMLGGGIKGGLGGMLGAGLESLGGGGALAIAAGLKMAKDKAVEFVSTLKDWWMAMNELAKAASPARAEQQQRAWNDLYAVLGRLFIPVLDQTTRAIRFVADAFQTLIPSTHQMTQITRNLEPLWKSMRDIFAELSPILRTLVQSEMTYLVLLTTKLANAMKPLLDAMAAGLKTLQALGMIPGGAGMASSVGASGFRGAFSSAEEYAKQQSVAAAMAGAAGGARPEQQTANNTAKMVGILEGIWAGITNPGRKAVGGMVHG